MKRMLTMMVVLAGASTTLADVSIPPQPGFKRVAVEHKITIQKDNPDYVFYSILAGKVTELKLDAKNAATLVSLGNKPVQTARLVAVPKDASKKFDGEKEFFEAIAKGQVEGMARSKTYFGATMDVKEKDAGEKVVMQYKIEKVDPKEGIVFVTDKKDAPKSKCDDSEDADETAPVAYTPKGGVWVAGLAGTFAVVLAGLWIARRGRRDLA